MKKSLVALILLGLSQFANAGEDFFSSVQINVDTLPSDDNSPVEFRGYVLAIGKYGLDAPLAEYAFERSEAGISQMRTDAFMELRGSASDSLQWQVSGKAELDWYRWESGQGEWGLDRSRLRLKDAFIDATFDNGLWIRAGHQIFTWGESEGLAVTDVLSPVDSRAPGQAELQDIREQIPAVLASIPAADGKLSLVVSYRAGHNRYAESEDDFYPYITLKDSGINIHVQDPQDWYEYAVRWERQFNGGDISFAAADVNANELSVVDFQQSNNAAPSLSFSQARVQMAGATANRVFGSWLLKGELAYHWGQMVDTGIAPLALEQDQWRSALVGEYSGFDDLLISLELNNIYALQQYEAEGLGKSKLSQTGLVFRVRQTALNERLTNQLWFYSLELERGVSAGSIVRADTSYDLSDSWELGLAAVIYTSTDNSQLLYPYQNNDSINATVKYLF